MFKSALLALSLTVSSLAVSTPALAETAAVPTDPARLKLAEQVVARLIPPGTYQKIMKDMMDTMAGGLVEQMMGMDAAIIAGMAGDEAGSDAAKAVEGKTMADIAVEKDPAFKERMDITMKVMFAEMGDLMSEMEPAVRTAMSNIYAKEYSAKELADMNTFFATPSGASFAGNFMSSFTDKEMMEASFGMMPKVMEAMPAIMKKVEAATAHLPPLPKSDSEAAMDAAVAEATAAVAEDPYANETGEEPWYGEESWTAANRKKAAKLGKSYEAASEKSGAAYAALEAVQAEAISEARARLIAAGWEAGPKPRAAEDIPADAVPPPVIPK